MAQRKRAKEDKLEIDMDSRLTDLWIEATEIEEWDLRVVGAFLRAAYGRGYLDALAEDKEGERGKLLYEHGFKIQ